MYTMLDLESEWNLPELILKKCLIWYCVLVMIRTVTAIESRRFLVSEIWN